MLFDSQEGDNSQRPFNDDDLIHNIETLEMLLFFKKHFSFHKQHLFDENCGLNV